MIAILTMQQVVSRSSAGFRSACWLAGSVCVRLIPNHTLMRNTLLAAVSLVLVTIAGVRAQPNDIYYQQNNLQSLLNNALIAVRNNDNVTACQLRSQALALLTANFNAFLAAFPNNNWGDLQTSLQDSVNQCNAKGR